MKKLLKIRFVKFNYAIVVQVLERTGEFENSEHVKVGRTFFIRDVLCEEDSIGIAKDNFVGLKFFGKNIQRDEYLDKVIKWISEEQFADGRKLEIGKKCEFSDNAIEWFRGTFGGKSAKQLGEPRFLAAGSDVLARYKYVRPIADCVCPKIDGDVYTWEMEVSE